MAVAVTLSKQCRNTVKQKDLLFEIGCEELPATGLSSLAHTLQTHIVTGLNRAQIHCGAAQWFATPRRLAVLIRDVATQQPTRQIERRGPALSVAYDVHGQPTAALNGFLKSVGINASELIHISTAKGTWLGYRDTVIGEQTGALLPTLIALACKQLPIPKLMRWNEQIEPFIRPVRWVVLLFGNTVVNATLYGHQAGRLTYGHHFMAPKAIYLTTPTAYESLLATQGHVIADFNKRKTAIISQINDIAAKHQAHAQLDESLLMDVCGLVEWPTALLAHFDAAFLSTPAEIIITAMQKHQKCFALLDKNAQLLPYFITISNLANAHLNQVISGNEKVMRARLFDATFFYTTDLKKPFSDYVANLKTMLFQAKLGTVFAKSQRIAELAQFILEKITPPAPNDRLQSRLAYHAGLLCKADLTTQVVGEFPELQGIMGYYYVQHDKRIDHSDRIAQAIRDHYKPRFAGDEVKIGTLAAAVALADKIDTLIGIIGTHEPPSSEKDPFGLRRAALGIIRLIVENHYQLNLRELLTKAASGYAAKLNSPQVVDAVFAFITARLRFYVADAVLFNAVFIRQQNNLYDLQLRFNALKQFLTLPQAADFIAANKRVNNLLAKTNTADSNVVTTDLLTTKAEQLLWHQLESITPHLHALCDQQRYLDAFTHLASLTQPINTFFAEAMVLANNPPLRKNRLALLTHLQQRCGSIADLTSLPS